jgi:hypothetical protein
MSTHEIVVGAGNVERLSVARPDDNLFWEGIEDEAGNRHALVLGSMDDTLILTGTLDELDRVADLVKRRVAERRFAWTVTQMRQADDLADRLMDEANERGTENEEMDVRADVARYAQEAAELAAELLGLDRHGNLLRS